MEWLVKNGSRPTNELLKKYLDTQTKLTHGASHRLYGKKIERFCNYYLEQHEMIKYKQPLGKKKAKPPVAMPRQMVGALTQHVVSRARSYRPLEEKCNAQTDAPVELARCLGKERL